MDWETSYSLQAEDVTPWFEREGGAGWSELRRETFALLQRDRELREVAGLVGPDALEDQDRLILETARLLREFLIGQSAYDPADAQSPVTKTWAARRRGAPLPSRREGAARRRWREHGLGGRRRRAPRRSRRFAPTPEGGPA